MNEREFCIWLGEYLEGINGQFAQAVLARVKEEVNKVLEENSPELNLPSTFSPDAVITILPNKPLVYYTGAL